jgi:hypothetical protein
MTIAETIAKTLGGQKAGPGWTAEAAWPDGPRALGGRLRRAPTFLRKIGIEISFGREGRTRTRTIRVTTVASQSIPESAGTRPSALSAQSAFEPKSNLSDSFGAARPGKVANNPYGSADGGGGGDTPTTRANSLKSHIRTAADRADANLPPQSALGAPGWGLRL